MAFQPFLTYNDVLDMVALTSLRPLPTSEIWWHVNSNQLSPLGRLSTLRDVVWTSLEFFSEVLLTRKYQF